MDTPQFDSLPVDGVDGRVILTRFPGRGIGDDFSLQRFEKVLSALSARGCRVLISLAEDREFAAFCGKALFAGKVAEHGLGWYHLPIPDFQPPEPSFLARWATVSDALLEELRTGHDVCLHCKGGIGRSGTVAAMLLIDQGLGCDEAITRVRRARKGAIETAGQEAFVRSYSRARKGSGPV